MGWIRGNPLALTILFFALAVFAAGYLPVAWEGAMSGSGTATLTFALLSSSLLFALLVLARILWVTRAHAKSSRGGKSARRAPP